MKRIFIAVAFLAAICAVCVYSSVTIKKAVSEMDAALVLAADYCEDENYDMAAAQLDVFDEKIAEYEAAFTAFLRRDYYYLLTNCAATLRTYNVEETKYDMIAELERTRVQLATIIHSWFFLL